MKPRQLLLPFMLAVAAASHAGDYSLDPAASHLQFRAVAENAEFRGEFTRFESRASFDPAAPESGHIEATVDIASVDTANGQRDELLVGPDWFNTGKWPRARFVTTRISRAGSGYRAEANLSVRDVTRPVIMDLMWTPEPGRPAARLKGTVRLKRLDFGLGQGDWQDTKYVGDAVTVDVDVHFVAAVASGGPGAAK